MDLNDFATFALCYGLIGPAGDCTEDNFECSDMDDDGEVTFSDFAAFALWFGLESSQTVPNCSPE